MNRMLVVIFDDETAAYAGCRALDELHAEGGISLYAVNVIAKDAQGAISVKRSSDTSVSGAGVGLAVGGLIGGPVGLAVGAVTGSLAGALRDYWRVGVDLDFVQEAERVLQPGKVALIAEVEEDWTIPVDTRMATAGGVVFRRARADVADAHLDHDIVTARAEIRDLGQELRDATGQAKARLTRKVTESEATLVALGARGSARIAELQQEAEQKVAMLQTQMAQASAEARSRLETRVDQVRTAYRDRCSRLKAAWQGNPSVGSPQ